MFTVTVTTTGAGNVVVHLPGHVVAAETATKDQGPSPIAPEIKELAWGAGAFIVLFVLMRLFLYPRLKAGMNARYGKIRGDHETAESVRAEAKAEVAAYAAELGSIKAEAAVILEAARRTLEQERSTAIAELNSRLAVRRTEAMAVNDQVRAAAEQNIREAVVDVSGRVAELAIGRRPAAATVNDVVAGLMGGAK